MSGDSGQFSSVLFRNLTKTVDFTGSKKPLQVSEDATQPVRQRPSEDQKRRRILDEVSGEVYGTEMFAVLGASGSGKTTLLQMIGGRNLAGTSGEVFLNGDKFRRQHRRSISFVEQEDVFFPSEFLTVRDQFDFSVTMRWASGTPKKTLDTEVENTLINLDLVAAADSPIMLISGGEKRRTSIGCELLCPHPRVLICDEGTSGLDSATSSKLVRTLRKLCQDKQIPVLMSIHQPSQSVFAAFDKVMFLAEGGKPVFYGAPDELMSYLHAVGFKQCGPGLNLIPPEFTLQLLALASYDDQDDDDVYFSFESPRSGLNLITEGIPPAAILIDAFDKDAYKARFYLSGPDRPSTDTRGREGDQAHSPRPREESKYDQGEPVVLGSVEHIEEAFRRRHLSHADEYGLMPTSPEQEERGRAQTPSGGRGAALAQQEWKLGYPANWYTQFAALLHRASKANSSRFNFLNCGQTLILGVLSGVAWFQVPLVETRLQDLSGYLFFTSTYCFFTGSFSGTLEFLPERPILKRERALGLYHLSAYLVAKQASTLPVRLVLPTVLVLISYLMAIPYVTPTLFFTVLAVVLLTSLVGESIGMFIGTLTLEFDKAIAIATVTLLGILLLGGFYVRELPYWLEWLQYTSPLRYSFAAVSQIQLTYAPLIVCDGFTIFTVEIPCVPDGTGQLVVPSNDIAKSFFNVDELSITANCVILLAFRTGFRFFTYLSLRFIRLNYGRT